MDYSNLTLREKILKTFIVTIREINLHGGPEEFFQKYPVGGMYYSENPAYKDENGMEIGTATTYETLKQCRKASRGHLWVVADGCIIQNQTKTWKPTRSLGASRSMEDAYNLGKVLGMQMNAKEIDCILGPAIDMYYTDLMYLNATCDDPELTGKIYRQVIRGIQDQGVCATAKHFPGLGTHFKNMHLAAGHNVLPFDQWMQSYGYTYKEMFKEDCMSVMTTHTTLHSYDSEKHDGYLPIATYSKKLTTELLKGELGFRGAVITDALIMGGMSTGDLVAESVQAFKCGADQLLWPPVEAADKIEELILSGEIPMSRLDDALERIGRMEDFRLHALETHAYDEPDPVYADKTLVDIANHGLCLLRNDIGLIPLSARKYRKVLIVDGTERSAASATDGRAMEVDPASRYLQQALARRGIEADIRRDIYDVPSNVCWQADLDRLEAPYDLVIFHMRAHFLQEWGETHMLIWASHQFKKSKKLIINYASPFFAPDYFPEDPTFVEANCVPDQDVVDHLVDALFGDAEFTGHSVLLHQN